MTYHSSRRFSFWELVQPWKILLRFMASGSLIKQFTKREIENRYKGTFLGLCWAFFSPLLMLAVYAVVFGFIFHGSYGHEGETKMQFVLGLFSGLLIWEMISTSLAMAPMLIVQNANLVTKVVFPLEILPVIALASNVVHAAIGFIPLLVIMYLFQKVLFLSTGALVLILIPIMLYTVGLVWMISGLGVFLRDIRAIMPSFITVLMFASAIFFPITAIPVAWRWVVMLNPAAVLVSMARSALVFGEWPDWKMYGFQLIISFVIAVAGYAFFMKVKPAFADVL